MTLLEVINLTKVYDKTLVVQGISFRVNKGQIVSLVGPNGAGKTTVLKMIMGFIKPTHGIVKVMGKEVKNGGNQLWMKRCLGFMPDTVIREDCLTGIQFLEILSQIQYGSCDRKKVMWALETVGLHDAKDQLIREYSRGMRQRLNLAQVLIHDPNVLVLDEPLTGIDPPSQKIINEILLSMKNLGKGILMSSHSETTLEVSDETLLIKDGRLVETQVTERGTTVYTLRCSAPTLAIKVLGRITDVKQIELKENAIRIWLRDVPECRREVLRALIEEGIDIESFSPQTLNDFISAGGIE